MSNETRSGREGGVGGGVAVVCEKGGQHAAQVEAYLRSNEIRNAEWFVPRDVDDVDEAVCAGRLGRVVFRNLSGLLEAIWDEEIQYDRWLSAGAEVAFVDSPQAGSLAAVVFRSWREWNDRRRIRQVVAGAILSVIALLAGFLLILSAL